MHWRNYVSMTNIFWMFSTTSCQYIITEWKIRGPEKPILYHQYLHFLNCQFFDNFKVEFKITIWQWNNRSFSRCVNIYLSISSIGCRCVWKPISYKKTFDQKASVNLMVLIYFKHLLVLKWPKMVLSQH